MGREEVTQFVEESDCVLLLGAFLTDIDMGIYTANLDPRSASTPPAKSCASGIIITTTSCWPTSSGRSPRTNPRPPDRAVPRARGGQRCQVRAAAAGADHGHAVDRSAERVARRQHDRHLRRGDALFAATELDNASRGPSSSAPPITRRWASRCRLRWARAWPGPNATVVLVGDGAFQMTVEGTVEHRPAQLRPHRDRAR